MRIPALCAAMLGIVASLHPSIARAEVRKPISGTVTDFKVSAMQIGVKSDTGEPAYFTVGPLTEVVQVPPGERDLSKAKPAKITDLGRGDRVLVSFVTGLSDARRIVWISATDIEARNAAERLDWQKRGISGTVTAREGNEIALEIRSMLGVGKTTLVVTDTTKIRRYSPDSVSFTDALPSTLDAIAKGDQVKTRGTRNAEGKLVADDIVFGTFATKMGQVESIDLTAHTIRLRDLASKQEVTVKVTAASQIKMLPDPKEMTVVRTPAGSHSAPPSGAGFDIGKTIAQLPAGKLEDVKAGSTLIVTSTVGAHPDEITAIMVMANADGLVQMARMQAKGGENMSAIDAMSTIHGGMLAGPTGLSIPTILP